MSVPGRELFSGKRLVLAAGRDVGALFVPNAGRKTHKTFEEAPETAGFTHISPSIVRFMPPWAIWMGLVAVSDNPQEFLVDTFQKMKHRVANRLHDSFIWKLLHPPIIGAPLEQLKTPLRHGFTHAMAFRFRS